MSRNISRIVLSVVKDGTGWVVQSQGKIFHRAQEKDEAKADAHKRARQYQDRGMPCMVRVAGEHGFV